MNLTAIIITFNEEPNIKRVLEKLTWIPQVIILDSGSSDNTLEIAGKFPNVKIFHRNFDSFAEQCNYGLQIISTEWTLSLDADYVFTDQLIKEIQNVLANPEFDSYEVSFRFCVYGYPLRSDNTTPRNVLFKTKEGKYINDGHAHRLSFTGTIGKLNNEILHDDRKDLSRWFKNQDKYSLQECHKIIGEKELRRIDKVRRLKWLAPFLVFFYCLFVKRLIFDGWHGWYYTLQRTMVEIMFTLRLIEAEKINKEGEEYKL
jgi:glycosyltransferase involved in cell wall biosynthesis